MSQDNVIKALEDQKYALDQAAIVAQTDAKGKITMVNDQFCKISGYSREELIGKDHRIVNSGRHDKNFIRQIWQTITSGNVWKGEICNKRKSGEFYWVQTTIVPFLDATGAPYQYLSIRQDITELKKAQETIIQQQEQIALASRLSAVGELAASITHEINNPLGVILGRCEMIRNMMAKNTLNPENLNRLVTAIETTGQRIDKIVKGMKLLSHQDCEDEPFTATSIDEILRDALSLCEERLRNHNIQLRVNDFDKKMMIECRPHHIVQIIVNLVNNAYDAILALPQKWIEIHVTSSGEEVEIVITDSGDGIPHEIVDKIFQPFFSTKRVQYGTGLGLSVSINLAKQNGGTLEYDKSCANTRFVLRLPFKQKQSE